MKNIAIIGANRGIGLEFVNQLSKENKVYAFCRSNNECLSSLKTEAVITDCDVSDNNSLKKAAEKVSGVEFDWFIHVSGILESDSFDNMNDSEIENVKRQFLVNSLGPLMTVKAFKKNLKKGTKIGLLTSRMGSVEDNTSGGMYGYRMSKSALNSCGKSLAEDFKSEEITCLLLHPGYVRTEMTGGNGHIETNESVEGLVKIMNEKSLKDTGTFWHTNGEKLPW